jgi:hypothetical protein
MDNPCLHSSGHIFDSPVMKLGQNACLGNCSDEFDGSGEWSRAIMALLLDYLKDKKWCVRFGVPLKEAIQLAYGR